MILSLKSLISAAFLLAAAAPTLASPVTKTNAAQSRKQSASSS